MGSLAMLAMAEHGDLPALPTDPRPVHPFFAPNRLPPPDSPEPQSPPGSEPFSDPVQHSDDVVNDRSDDDAAAVKSAGRGAKRRKVEAEPDTGTEPKRKRGRPRKIPLISNLTEHLLKPNQDAPASTKNGDSSNTAAQNGRGNNPQVQEAHNGGDLVKSTSPENGKPPLPPQDLASTPSGDASKPKKLLLFNPKTGTIGPPPVPKQHKTVVVPEIGEGGGSKATTLRRSARKPAARLVTIKYGTDDGKRIRLGAAIDAILSGQRHIPAPLVKQAPSSKTSPKSKRQAAKAAKPDPTKPPKSTHPFFMAKAKKADAASEEPSKKDGASSVPPRPKQFSSTPCSPKKPRAPAPAAIARLPQVGSKSADRKFPGAKLAAWPWKDMVHVRGDDSPAETCSVPLVILPSRKSKGHSVKVAASESVMKLATSALRVPAMAEAVRNATTDDFLPPPPELRLPQKRFESGSKLQARVLPQLRSFQSHRAPKASRRNPGAGGKEERTHVAPQLASLFGSISSGLSAFDKAECETSNWAQKYAPANATEVLQPGREAFLLRDWLQALMVQAVDTGSTEGDKAKGKLKAVGLGKKKRRKKLDGFIVESEDDAYEPEASDEEQDWGPSGIRGVAKQTVVRSKDLSKPREGAKIANALVISGPHGCGKTAAVYAVAKELNFEVFEINSSSRRSGKDIMKIGDMTRNHHVQQNQSTASAGDAEATAADDTTAHDVKSGKQATMAAFFKPKATTAKPKPAVAAPVSAEQPATAPVKEPKKEASNNQRQSLILLEEVDILYEEDKQFWTTVVNLMAQSKRPFIMTCNDETLIPMQTLRLHGIFRFSPPPRDLAIDRLLLIAANEGHALERQAVELLYESRQQDLRAATMDLQYWCQIGVGDRRGGFDWFYPRFPKGNDLDENEEVVRVVSEGTYRQGMNWLGRDIVTDPQGSAREIEEELLQQSWDSWGLDIGDWQDTSCVSSWAESLSSTTATPAGRLEALQVFDTLSEAMSTADLCARRSFGAFTEVSPDAPSRSATRVNAICQEPLDATSPDLSAKARDDYILGLAHLHTPPATRHDSLMTTLPTSIKSLARATLRHHAGQHQLEKAGQPVSQLEPLDEPRVLSCIERSLTSVPTPTISRMDFAFAFDPIAAADTTPLQAVSYLDPSVFDRTLKLIALEVAPYVRGIVAYDSQLLQQRLKLSNLLSEGGGDEEGHRQQRQRGSKRMRTTRAALSALEGGSRSTTRAERWFKADLNPYLVMRTGGEGWGDAIVLPPVSVAGSSSGDGDGEGGEGNSPGLSSSPPPEAVPKRRGRKKKLQQRQVVLEDDEEGDAVGAEGGKGDDVSGGTVAMSVVAPVDAPVVAPVVDGQE